MTNSFIYSIQQSGLVGQIILIILLALSIISWAIIIQKALFFKKIKKATANFLTSYTVLGYEIIYSQNNRELYQESPLFTICKNACEKISRLAGQKNVFKDSFVGEVASLIKEELNQEVSRINHQIFLLATISSVAPFFGLLGTVWGIMNAFTGMSIVGAASIGSVAPGIAEALITTVIGLIVAIPALIGYNYFSNEIALFTIKLEDFASKLFNTIKQTL